MATQAGQRISDPNELSTLTEGDLARVGKDIYRRDLAKEQEFAKTWTGGRGTVETDAAFNKAVYAPEVAPQPEIINRDALLQNIQQTATNAGDKQANEAYIRGVSKYATGRDAAPEEIASYQGKTVRQIADQYGISDKIPGFNIPTEDTVVQQQQKEEEQPRSTDPIGDAIDKMIALKQGNMREQVDVNSYLAKKQTASAEVEKARQAIADKKLIDAEMLQTIGERPIAMTFINRQKEGYNAAQYITDLKMAQDYNNKLILAKMAEGNFLEAQRINKDIANDNYEIAKLQIEKARNDQVINDKEADRLEKEADYQRTMAENGYIYVSDKDQLNSLTEDQIYRDPVNGRIYKKPEVEDEVLSINEAKALGVPYGTTQSQAIAMGINPAEIEASRRTSRSSGSISEDSSSNKNTYQVGDETLTETGDALTDAVNFLDAHKRQGTFNDVNYRQTVNGLMNAMGYDEDNREKVERMLNDELHKRDSIITPIEEDTNPSSDFVVETPAVNDLANKGATVPEQYPDVIGLDNDPGFGVNKIGGEKKKKDEDLTIKFKGGKLK